MIVGDLDVALVLRSVAFSLAAAAAVAVIVGAVYAVLGALTTGAGGGRDGGVRHRLAIEAAEGLAAGGVLRRAAGVAIALLGLVAAAPLLGGHVGDLWERWQTAAEASGTWAYAALAAAIWLGLVPLAIFLWLLPRRESGRSSAAGVMGAGWAAGRTGLPAWAGPDDLAESVPHAAPLRRACRLHALNATLGFARRGHGGLREAAAFVVFLIVVPLGAATALAATINLWLSGALAGTALILALATFLWAEATARRAPGTALLDYLLLVASARNGTASGAVALAETYLDRSPATHQDHEHLVRVLAGARWVGEPDWNPLPAAVPEVTFPVSLPFVDRLGRDRGLDLTFRLRYHDRSGWQIVRLWIEETAPPVTAGRR